MSISIDNFSDSTFPHEALGWFSEPRILYESGSSSLVSVRVGDHDYGLIRG